MHEYCNKWRLKANVSRALVGEWKWGKHALLALFNYTYLGINFACKWGLGCAYQNST